LRILLVVYDNDSYIHWFPQGIAYIASMLKKSGFRVEIYNQDKNHYPEEHLTDYLDKEKFDVVGVGVIAGYYQYKKLLSISKAINNSKQRPFFIIGGHGPSPEPEYFLKKSNADIVVIGEGEETIIEVIDSLVKKKSFHAIKGIAFRDEAKFVVNERRQLISDLDKIPFPAYELFPVEYYRLLRMPYAENSDFVMPLLSGRGCPYKCTFCYRIDEGFRPRSNESIIEEIQMLKIDYGITYIAFSDELLMSSDRRTMSLCEDFIKAKLKIKWDCNGRLNYAKPEILKLMREAGCVFINYGIESMDDEVLKKMKKGLNTCQVVKGIESTLRTGISPGFNIIFGNIGDSRETLNKGVKFLLKYDDGAQMRTIRPVTPYPGSLLYYYAIQHGFLKDCEDFYENKHINSDLLSVNFTELTDEEFNLALFEANEKLIENYFQKKELSLKYQARNLYLNRDSSFRGFRHT